MDAENNVRNIGFCIGRVRCPVVGGIMKLRALDLFCCAGGASEGYARAGFEMVGVDIAKQPHYPFAFIRCDALELGVKFLQTFDFIHASPPCQRYSQAQRLMKNQHADLIGPTRDHLKASGVPYAIENVVGAPLIRPVELCGPMFGLTTYRHRRFECSFPIEQPMHYPHTVKQTKMGRKPKPGEFIQVVGNFSGVPEAQRAMGINWMNQAELREAIPPAYTEYVGTAAREYISRKIAA